MEGLSLAEQAELLRLQTARRELEWQQHLRLKELNDKAASFRHSVDHPERGGSFT